MSSCEEWASIPLAERVSRVCALRHVLAEDPRPFVDAVRFPSRRSPAETIAGELTPLADACRFLERNAAKILRRKRLGAFGRPLWLAGVDASIYREPLGTVLIIGPSNYPLMLPGIQSIQALVCGNRVLWKPAPGTGCVAALMSRTFADLGVPAGAFVALDETIDSIAPWLAETDKVILTGSRRSGTAVMRTLAEHATPSIMELSGSDPMIVLPDADLDLVADCVRFGLQFNGSSSCIAPRRIVADRSVADVLACKLTAALSGVGPVPIPDETRRMIDDAGRRAIDAGARLIAGRLPCEEAAAPLLFDFARPEMSLVREDFMAPVASMIRADGISDALAVAADNPRHLGASIFGSPRSAEEVARRVEAGSVVINDVIVPTADPRLPFGGFRGSGFGVTRGAEGLLEMTRIKTVSTRRHGPRFHLPPEGAHTSDVIRFQLQAVHSRTAWKRLLGGFHLVASVRRQLRSRAGDKEEGNRAG